MAILGLSNQKNANCAPEENVYCPIRTAWVKSTPEEKVRQQLLFQMIRLGYPANHITVERKIKELPHLGIASTSFPNRRIDILCYATGLHPDVPLYPLLLIECKAVPLTKAVMRQVAGYNFFVGALFYAVANEKSVSVNGKNQQEQIWERLPSYAELMVHIGIK